MWETIEKILIEVVGLMFMFGMIDIFLLGHMPKIKHNIILTVVYFAVKYFILWQGIRFD